MSGFCLRLHFAFHFSPFSQLIFTSHLRFSRVHYRRVASGDTYDNQASLILYGSTNQRLHDINDKHNEQIYNGEAHHEQTHSHHTSTPQLRIMDSRTAHDVPSEYLVLVDVDASLDPATVAHDRLGHRNRHPML
jgi:hypothetical protein